MLLVAFFLDVLLTLLSRNVYFVTHANSLLTLRFRVIIKPHAAFNFLKKFLLVAHTLLPCNNIYTDVITVYKRMSQRLKLLKGATET